MCFLYVNLYAELLLVIQIVEFIAVLLKSGNEAVGTELARSGTIKRILELFFE